MKTVMFAINKPHTDNIKLGIKISELRTRPPKINEPYRAYIYETLKNGGCGKVIGEFIAFNENTYRICTGVPKHLTITACVTTEEILRYTKNGKKDLTEISISDLKIYDKPKELSEFYKDGILNYDDWLYGIYNGKGGARSSYESYRNVFKLKRPPQSWCYISNEN